MPIIATMLASTVQMRKRYTQRNRPLHIVCGIIEGELLVITAYEPSFEEWKPDWKTRR
jgi:hypothetical protein